MIVSVDLSGYVIVAVPSFPTVTFVPSGNLSLFASSIAFLTAAFSSSVKLSVLATFVFAGTVGSVLSAVVGTFASPSADSLSLASFAFAVTFSPALILSFGSVTTPVASSIFIDVSVPSGNVHLFISFVATSVCVFPSWSLYVIVTVCVSSSVGGVTTTSPLSFASTFGAAGGVVSAGILV